MIIDKTLSDKDILEKSINNPQYFELLVMRYQNQFLRKSLSIIRSKEEAEDIVQETFLKIYKYGKNFRERENASFKSWAYEILRNTSYSHYKKQKKRQSNVKLVDFSQYDFEDVNTPLPEDSSNENKSYVESILSLMPQSLADILRLYFLEEKSQKEIAQMEHISPGAVRTRIHRAKNFFRKLSTHTI